VKTSKPAIAISLLIIALGVAWLLNAMQVIPGVDWIWVGGLGVSGVLLLALAKLDRFNFVVGTSLIVCSILSVLRQTKVLTVNIEAPVMFICVGILLLFSHLFRIPSVVETAPPPTPISPAPASTNETQI
jgi:hypothetical protein